MHKKTTSGNVLKNLQRWACVVGWKWWANKKKLTPSTHKKERPAQRTRNNAKVKRGVFGHGDWRRECRRASSARKRASAMCVLVSWKQTVSRAVMTRTHDLIFWPSAPNIGAAFVQQLIRL